MKLKNKMMSDKMKITRFKFLANNLGGINPDNAMTLAQMRIGIGFLEKIDGDTQDNPNMEVEIDENEKEFIKDFLSKTKWSVMDKGIIELYDELN